MVGQSDERLEFAIAMAQIGFWDWDLQQHQQQWSPQTEQMLGY